MEVLQLLAEGFSNKQIATRLTITPRTVNFHLDHIYAKLSVNTRTEASIAAMRLGWIKRGEHPS
jgi:LuxR family maltose regulon positive regulatory protein